MALKNLVQVMRPGNALHQHVLDVFLQPMVILLAQQKRSKPSCYRAKHPLQDTAVVSFERAHQPVPQLLLALQVFHHLGKIKEVVYKHSGIQCAHLWLTLQEETLNVSNVLATDAHRDDIHWPEAHLDGQPVCDNAEQKAGEGQQDEPGRAFHLAPSGKLNAPAYEAQCSATTLDETELLLAHPEKKSVQERLVVHEDTDYHAIVVYTNPLITEQFREVAPQLWARLLDFLNSCEDHLLPRGLRQLLLPELRAMRPSDVVERTPDDPLQLRPRCRDQELRVHPAEQSHCRGPKR
eukprot:CAMPEP_0179182038 /NCGR_PEP_ID=MMETSP0796-20121207/90183_1 /TAXON_ID=73915 /ORGANISM="Pyrodinium bahamense, Strain pbaha01" /LENGTH=293 /DNA_ID=CAMNT_0020885855 /DNA_START=327 /DNA_END=1208 /DNA_ORIENTATION=+